MMALNDSYIINIMIVSEVGKTTADSCNLTAEVHASASCRHEYARCNSETGDSSSK